VAQLGAAINHVGNLQPTIDLSGLDAAVARIRSAIASLNSLAGSTWGVRSRAWAQCNAAILVMEALMLNEITK
jgi:hypothetical protein